LVVFELNGRYSLAISDTHRDLREGYFPEVSFVSDWNQALKSSIKAIVNKRNAL
jgi:hypothetical protein